MWIDTRDCVPLTDGEYVTQSVFGEVQYMYYTSEGGWNTHRDENGTLYNERAIDGLYVARWYSVPSPKEVPEEWLNAYREHRKGVKR